MNPELPKYGRTEDTSTRLLEPADFDFFDGSPPPADLGRTGVPVNVLSSWLLDGADPVASPALVLTLHLRRNAIPAAVTFDLFAAFSVLNRYEISLGGKGLVADETRSDLAASGETIRLVLLATESVGSADRLRRLAAVINGQDASVINGHFGERSFGGCEAAVCAA